MSDAPNSSTPVPARRHSPTWTRWSTASNHAARPCCSPPTRPTPPSAGSPITPSDISPASGRLRRCSQRSTSSDDALTSDSITSTESTGTIAVSETTSVVETTQPPATTDLPDTTEPATTEPSATEAPSSPEAVRPAIWPWADTETRYGDPLEAATGFAADFLGFDDPIASEFMAGDSRSGEVEVQAFASGPVTLVFVRQLTDDDSWWILGAVSENIAIDEPDTGTEVTSPLTVSGTALAFEGTVDLELRADGNGEPIFESFVTGSGGPEPGPYSESVEFTSPGAISGALVMLSRSSEDGSVIEASALRVFYR